ncbi:MAG: UDP-N-acetylmuramoyl-tripeptide--D-alanyl-D-alanine ligase [bacterium]
MNLLKPIFLILVSIISIKYILFWTYIWQLKEYRWDRFKDFLNSHEGRIMFFNTFYLGKIFASIAIIMIWTGFFFIPYAEAPNIWLTIDTFFIAATILFLFFETSLYLKRLLKKTVKIPFFTKKALLLILLSGLMTFYLIISSYPPHKLILLEDIGIFVCLSLLSLILIPLFTAFSNLFIYPFSYILKKQRIKKASAIIEKFNGTVIGITGSYGKSSVKEYVASLLGKKFDVIKTPKNVNTEIGVANFIIQELRKRKDEQKPKNSETAKLITIEQNLKSKYFACEMGAYRSGEIKKLCDMVKPSIGILTGINEQHIALFGSIENTIKAKTELIQALPKDGIAIINNDDENCRSVKITDGIKKITYGFSENSDIQIEIKNLEISDKDEGCIGTIKIIIKIDGIHKTMRINAFGKHSALNILPAIAIAKEAGMKLDEIKEAVENLEPPKNGMNIKKIGKAIIIDDTYNSNPTGIKAALEAMDSIDKPDKILILDDIWELGKESKRIHRELAKIIAEKNYSKIILTGKNYAKFMKDELVKNGVSADNIATKIILKNYLKIDSAILFEGRMSKKYLEQIFTNQ